MTLSSLDSFTAAAVAVAVALLSLAKWPPSDDLLLLDSSTNVVCAGFCLRMFFFLLFLTNRPPIQADAVSTVLFWP